MSGRRPSRQRSRSVCIDRWARLVAAISLPCSDTFFMADPVAALSSRLQVKLQERCQHHVNRRGHLFDIVDRRSPFADSRTPSQYRRGARRNEYSGDWHSNHRWRKNPALVDGCDDQRGAAKVRPRGRQLRPRPGVAAHRAGRRHVRRMRGQVNGGRGGKCSHALVRKT